MEGLPISHSFLAPFFETLEVDSIHLEILILAFRDALIVNKSTSLGSAKSKITAVMANPAFSEDELRRTSRRVKEVIPQYEVEGVEIM